MGRRRLRRAWALFALLALSASTGASGAEDRIVDAAKRGDEAALRALIAQRADVNAPAADGTTALHWAAHRGDVTAVDLLIRANGNVNARNRYGMTPLVVACVNENASVVERLLGAGADPNLDMPGAGDTPLMTAARTGNVRIIQMLLRHGAAVNATEHMKGQTALMWAAAEDNVAAVRALIDAGANIEARSRGEQGFTPLLFAVRGGSTGAARTLLDAGANPDDSLSGGMSALVLAVVNARYDMAALLLDYGADPNAAQQGWTALHQVAWTRKPNTNVNFPVSVPRGGLDSLRLVTKLLQYGADPNARVSKEPDGVYLGRYGQNHIGGTPFFVASFLLDLPLMRVLLEGGADPLLANVEHTTPLMAAAGVGFFVEGEHPFTADEALSAVRLCLEAGGDATGADLNGDTPLHGAAYRGVNAVVRLLVDHGAALDAVNHPVVNKGAPRGDNAQQRLLHEQAARAGGWTPWRIAAGVSDIFGLRQKLETAALLRQLMEARGLWTAEMAREAGSTR